MTTSVQMLSLRPAWKALKDHFEQLQSLHLRANPAQAAYRSSMTVL